MTVTKKLKKIVAITVSLLLLAYFLFSFVIVNGIAQVDRRSLANSPADYGASFQNLSFSTRHDSLNLKGWYLAGREEWPAIILVHGINTNRSANGLTEMATRLHERGFGVLLFDLRAHGESEGKKASGGWNEKWDVLGAYDYLVSQGVKKIAVIGVSMGAGTASMAAAEEEGIAGLVMDSSFSSVLDLLSLEVAHATTLPKWFTPVFSPGIRLIAPLFLGIPVAKIEPKTKVADLAYPILLIHSTGDTRIPSSHSDIIYDHAPAGSQLWKVDGVAHAQVFPSHPDEYIERISAYFHQRLGPRE